MDEFNQDTPYFEAVSLCVKNDSTERWRQWTRVADIVDEKLCECRFDDDEQENSNEQKYAFSNRYTHHHSNTRLMLWKRQYRAKICLSQLERVLVKPNALCGRFWQN